jgi:hypothetical protein
MLVYVAEDHVDVAVFRGRPPASPVMTSSAQLCETCRLVEARDPGNRRLAEWAHLDVTAQHPPAAAPQQGLVLVARPPMAGTLTGQIKLRSTPLSSVP